MSFRIELGLTFPAGKLLKGPASSKDYAEVFATLREIKGAVLVLGGMKTADPASLKELRRAGRRRKTEGRRQRTEDSFHF